MPDQDWKRYWASTAGSVLLLAQIVLWPVLGLGPVRWLAYAGMAVFALAAAAIATSILQLTRQGGAAKGDNPTETTTLIETGLYAIVRHPFYLALPFINAAMMLITQHWIVVALGIVSAMLSIVDFRKVDADEGADKWGDAYRDYAERVPGWNPIVGVWRLIRRRLARG